MLYKDINHTINSRLIEQITTKRKALLKPLINYIQSKKDRQQPVRLNFICTHNSRRSHLAQTWAQSAAHHYGIENVSCYSGGTEATALFPLVIKTLQAAGFKIHPLSKSKNGVSAIKFSENEHPVIGFSKRFDHAFNPKNGFAAITTCSQADEACPYIPGAEKRIPLPYKDPKIYDGTPQQARKYEERSLQIAEEMIYVFSKITL